MRHLLAGLVVLGVLAPATAWSLRPQKNVGKPTKPMKRTTVAQFASTQGLQLRLAFDPTVKGTGRFRASLSAGSLQYRFLTGRRAGTVGPRSKDGGQWGDGANPLAAFNALTASLIQLSTEAKGQLAVVINGKRVAPMRLRLLRGYDELPAETIGLEVDFLAELEAEVARGQSLTKRVLRYWRKK